MTDNEPPTGWRMALLLIFWGACMLAFGAILATFSTAVNGWIRSTM